MVLLNMKPPNLVTISNMDLEKLHVIFENQLERLEVVAVDRDLIHDHLFQHLDQGLGSFVLVGQFLKSLEPVRGPAVYVVGAVGQEGAGVIAAPADDLALLQR